MVDLNAFLPSGFTQSIAKGIDANGDIIGYAWGPASGGNTQAFLWIPEPGSLVLISVTGLLLLRRRGRI